jgi:phage-related protein
MLACLRSFRAMTSRHDGDTFRAVDTVRLASAVYVLHVFQKKAKHGIATPKKDMDLIRARLKLAIADDQNRS